MFAGNDQHIKRDAVPSCGGPVAKAKEAAKSKRSGKKQQEAKEAAGSKRSGRKGTGTF
jgi:hypothetical protein